MTDQMYFPIKEIFKEAKERSVARARLKPELIDALILSEEDHQLMGDYLKSACDELYIKLQTLLSENPYEYEPKSRVVFNFNLPDNYNKKLLPAVFTLCKNYMVEAILKGHYTEIGFQEGIVLTDMKHTKMMDKLQTYRIARTTMTKRKYVGL